MFVRALFAFLALPGVFAGIIPWGLVSLDPWRRQSWTFGVFVLAFGLWGLLWCVRDFYVSGKGTLAPWDPPKHLVEVGLYRFTRNPMYLSVLMLVGGWGLLTGSPLLAGYLVALALTFHLRVVLYEERRLSQQFGAEWLRYSAAVPRWAPRVKPWRG